MQEVKFNIANTVEGFHLECLLKDKRGEFAFAGDAFFKAEEDMAEYIIKKLCENSYAVSEDTFWYLEKWCDDVCVELSQCAECGMFYHRNFMTYTKDCHGIPFRRVCYDCKEVVMRTKPFDGEYYNEEAM